MKDLRHAGMVSPPLCREKMELEEEQCIVTCLIRWGRDFCLPCRSWSAHQNKLFQPLKPTRQPLAVQTLNPKKQKHQTQSALPSRDAVTPLASCLHSGRVPTFSLQEL